MATSFFGSALHTTQHSDIDKANTLFEEVRGNIDETFADFPATSSFDWPIVSLATSLHYTWADICNGWHLLQSPTLSVIQERMPPDTAEIKHKHSWVRQFFYVLSGELTLKLEGEVFKLGPQQGLEIVPGRVHQARNESDGPVEFLVISDGISRETPFRA
ncbi:cupin domain-containing protein [Deinococcus sp. Arct2-2]|nr:cupin domain-containing protein [Deinococcus sp. Arct2-2]